jgi:hypothetical protein
MRFLKSDAVRMVALSFAILFWELVCIRWLSAYVLYLGYFTNFVLLGALLGIGAGALLAPRPRPLIGWLPPLLFVFFALVLFTRTELTPGDEKFIYFSNSGGAFQLPPYILLPAIFGSVTAIFTLMSHELGQLFTRLKPLPAYNLNIFGSLAGIALFTLLSFLSAPAWMWFFVGGLALAALVPTDRTWGRSALLLGGLVMVIFASDFAFRNVWTPYYRMNVVDARNPGSIWLDPNTIPRGSYTILANGARHQAMDVPEQVGQFYARPYTSFATEPHYDNVLIIGAGSGNDVAMALAHNVGRIDAVEIDPTIVALGQRLHPAAPYDDSRVTVYIDDARAFLEKTDKKYDLVIFALPDSLVLASSFGSVRLESYLFTKEAFQSVQKHLTAEGMVVLYNYYRYDWLIDKLLSMLRDVFGQPTVFHQYNEPQFTAAAFATLFAGPRASALDLAKDGFSTRAPVAYTPATDNWPFLYMQAPDLPGFYGLTLILILVFAALYIGWLAPRGALLQRSNAPFFFMGAAFTLLQTRSIVQLLLLFGSTWLVNALSFFAILAVVLVANALAARFRFQNVGGLFALLFGALVLNYALPIKALLIDPPLVRYALAIALMFSPIFFANLIYSTLFRDTLQAGNAYGANLLGSIIGGASEYLALYFGYQNLMLFATLFYALAFGAFFWFNRARPPASVTH